MDNQTRELLQAINNKKEEVRRLAKENKVNEAQQAKQELIRMQAKFDAIYDLDAESQEGVKEKIKNGKLLNITDGNGILKRGEIFNKGDRLVDSIPKTEETLRLDLGRYIKGAITGDWNNASRELDQFKALSTGTGKILIPTILSADIIDLARNKSVIFGGGVPLIKMESNNITIGKVKTDPEFAFKAEGAEATPSEMTFEGVELKSKTAYGLMKVTLEVLHSAQNLSSIIQNSMSQSIANMIDKACLFGSSDIEPNGILNNTDINIIEATNQGYVDYVKAVGAIRRNNGEPTTMVINSDVDERLNLLTDNTGNPLGIPKVIDNLSRLVSNQLPNNEGVGLNESISMVFDPFACLVGMQVPIGIEMSREQGFADGTVLLRIYSMLDIAVVQPRNISKITKQIQS